MTISSRLQVPVRGFSIRRALYQLSLSSLFAVVACTPDVSPTAIGTGHPVAALVADSTVKPLAQLQKEYVDLRFGMFLHFGILTYTGTWAQPNLPIDQFNPTNLNPGQWAMSAC
jgi:hypothetical protein